MANILKGKTQLRVKEFSEPLSEDKILGTGIDVMTMPDSHLCCSKCSKPFFEVWVYTSNHYIEVGCVSCGWSTRLLLPYDIDLSKRFGEGKFECFKHKDKGFVIIKNSDVLCVGCRYCKTEVQIKLDTKTNIILSDA